MSLPASEVYGWLAYYNLEPWGSKVDDLRMGILASVSAAPYCNTTPKPDDFIPKWGGPKAQDPEQMRAIFAQFVTMHQHITRGKGGSGNG